MENIKGELLKLYPDRKVVGLISKKKYLYQRIWWLAQAHDKDIPTILKDLGFQFVRATSRKLSTEELLQELVLAFPTKTIRGIKELKEKYPTLRLEVLKVVKKTGLTEIEWLESQGYTVSILPFTEEEIVRELHEVFPAKVIKGVKEIKDTCPELRMKMLKLVRKSGLTEVQWIESHGFTVFYPPTALKAPCIDVDTLLRLNNEFFISQSELGQLFNISRQRIDQIILKPTKRRKFINWNTPFTKQELDFLHQTVKEGLVTKYEDDRFIRIYESKSTPKRYAVLYKRGDIVKCLFNLPAGIMSELKKMKM